MAEFVEFRSEEWIAELEQLERIRLFESNEIKTIANKRRELEYKIQRRTKNKEDFLKYIQFEVDLHRIIKARRKKTGIRGKKVEIEFNQTHRIGRLFKQVIFKFQNDVKLWTSFIQFCKEFKFQTLISQMLVKMLQIHSDKPHLWVFASDCELENSVDNARRFLTKGLRHHPSSELLYTALYKLELENMKRIMREKEDKMEADEWVSNEVTDNIIKGKIAGIVYESAVKNIKDVEFKVTLLNIAKDYEGTASIQNKIFEDLLKSHPQEELTYDTIAKQELEGIQVNISQITKQNESMEIDSDPDSNKNSVKSQIQRSINVYEEAVKNLNTVRMWSFYLDHVIELNKNVSSLPVFKFKLLQNALEGALESGKMDEKYFLHWVELLEKSGKKNKTLSVVLEKGTEQHPKSLELWYARLRFHLSKNQKEVGTAVFNEALQKLSDTVPLWKLMVHYCQLKSQEKVEDIFQDGIQQGGEVAQALKPLYIEWLASAKGIADARKAFESSEIQHPPCLELYKIMAGVELTQPQICSEKVRRCHELACFNFGGKDFNVWLEHIKFELNNGDLKKVNEIYRRALKTLEPEQVDEFVIQYNAFKTEDFS